MNDAYEEMMEKARRRDAKVENSERRNGFASPQRCDLHCHLRTVESALECAVKMRDWNTACEAMVLLQQAIVRVAPDRKVS